MKSRGFTIIELIIVVIIMGTLLVLGVANLRTTQISARDSERKTDVEIIAMSLDNYYKYGTTGSTSVGQYPSTLLTSGSVSNMTLTLRDIDTKAITAPGITDPTLTFISATNSGEGPAAISPQPTINQYVYQPLQSDGSLCTLETHICRRFRLYYRLEIDDMVHMLTSKNQ